jgi:6-phospho-3-hexuloisomerase
MNAVEEALAEMAVLKDIIANVDSAETSKLADEITAARRIFVGGAGRSLLSMKGFAMRLMQTNHETYLVGEVCTPSVQPGDLLIVASGRGTTKVTLDLVLKAKSHGARTAVITMNRDAPIPNECHCVVVIPKTPPVAEGENSIITFAKKNLPGNFAEAAITLILDGVTAELMERVGQTGDTINANHANLE